MSDPSSWQDFELVVKSRPNAVRNTLVQLRRVVAPLETAPTFIDRLELVLAEALNNVVEHAYRDNPDGTIWLRFSSDPSGLIIQIRDNGVAAPDSPTLDQPQFPNLAAVKTLPEGGFGRHLIRHLADRVEYRRLSGQNCLILHVPFCEWQN